MMSHQQKLFPQKSEQQEGEEGEYETCTNLKSPPPYGRGLIPPSLKIHEI